MKLQNLKRAGAINNCKFEWFVTAHKEQHTILEGLTNHGYNESYNRTRVACLIDGVKLDSFNTVKAMILSNSGFFKDFEKCVTLYKYFLNQYDSTQSETRRVSDVISGRRGVIGGVYVKDYF